MGNFPFFIEAKNVFDIWSFDEDEPRIAAGEQRGEKTIFLKKYH
ncbi:MAG: Bax protein, partial [Bermanella sp.]